MAGDSKTVFVKGIKYSTSKEHLEQAFSEIGPVRSCFLVQYAETDRHQGCAFVQYALADDASRALQQLNGSFVDGRRVQVEQARRRAPLEERKQRKRFRGEEDQDTTVEAPAAEAPQPGKKLKGSQRSDKQALVRTVAVGAVIEQTQEQLSALAASVGKIESCTFAVGEDVTKSLRLDRDGCTPPVALLQYLSVKDAMRAVASIHGHMLEGKQNAQPQTRFWARQAAGEGAHLKKWRIIIRNLPFNVQEEDLRRILSPGGFVWQLSLPKDDKGKQRGFAFATMTCLADVQKAIKMANGQMLKGRALAVDWAVPKSQYQTSSAPAAGAADDGKDAPAADADAIPVDQAPDAPDAQPEAAGTVQDGAEELAEDTGAEQAMMRSLVGQVVSEADANGPSAAAAAAPAPVKQDMKTARQKPAEETRGKRKMHEEPSTAPEQNLAATVFVRGLPRTVTQTLLHAALAAHGAVASCRLVMHKSTGKPKGTAFVEFADAAGAAAAATACAQAREGAGPAVTVQGTPIEVNLALSQDDVRNLAVGKSASVPSDNRSLYLAREGAIEEASAAWNALSAADQARRKQAAQDKAAKLKSPNFFVSRTRLSLRNLPKTLDEAALKTLLVAAVKQHASKAKPQIKQVKILRDPARPDKQGKPSSKGMGFAELTSHEHALCALRELNNNPTTFGADRRPIVEFAIENAQTVKKRRELQERQKRKAGEATGEGEQAAAGTSASAAAMPYGKRQKKETIQATRGTRLSDNQKKHGQKPVNTAVGTAAAAAVEPALASGARPAQGKRHAKAADQHKPGAGQKISTASGNGIKNSDVPKNKKQAIRTANQQHSARTKPGRADQRGPASVSIKAPAASKNARPGTPGTYERARAEGKAQPTAARSMQQAAGGAKKKAGRAEKKDGFDSLAAQYKAKLFGTGSASGSSPLQAMKRWFE